MEGWLKAVNAKTGEVLWKFKTPSGIIGNPITYVGPDNKQYVAILSGIGGWSGIGAAADIGSDDPTAGLGALGAFGDVSSISTQGGVLTVFSLPWLTGAGRAGGAGRRRGGAVRQRGKELDMRNAGLPALPAYRPTRLFAPARFC
jgi:hypothetical protein